MISAMLRKTGVYLGEEMDFLPARNGENANGFWEHFGFYALNERLLMHLGAGWDMPELPGGWASRGDLEPFREEARQLITRMSSAMNGSVTWGWKDPRNSITIEFWESLLPDLRVVVCVRNPIEVAASLQKRNNLSFAASCNLWYRYYSNLLEKVPPEKRVVTFYETYFDNPDPEIKRLIGKLSLPNGAATTSAARGSVNPRLHHQQATYDQLLASGCSPQVIELYRELRAEAAGNIPAAPMQAPVPAPVAPQSPVVPEDLVRSRFHAEVAAREDLIRRMALENTELRKSLEGFKAELEAIREEMAASLGPAHPYARNLSAMAQRAITLHGIVSHKRSRFALLQSQVEATLKETKPMWPRFIRCSNTINSVYRIFKRIRKQGKLFSLQREMNDYTFELLGALTHIAAVTSGHGGESYASAPGLERYAVEKISMDVPNLMEMLRIRLS